MRLGPQVNNTAPSSLRIRFTAKGIDLSALLPKITSLQRTIEISIKLNQWSGIRGQKPGPGPVTDH